MREILFRGKRLDNGEWVEGSFLQDGEAHRLLSREDLPFSDCYIVPKTDRDNVRRYLTQGICLDIRAHHVDPATVSQYTGLKDKNGKRIFEGDIVHYLYEPGKGYWNSNQNSVIEWKATGFFMCGIMGTNKYACSTGWLVSTPHGDGKCFEVIGNIHDNPELLEVRT